MKLFEKYQEMSQFITREVPFIAANTTNSLNYNFDTTFFKKQQEFFHKFY